MNSALHTLVNDPRSLELSRVLGPHGSLYVVGGAVRDALMGRSISDIDYTYSLSPDRTIELLSNAGIRVIPTGLSHQTVTVKLDGDLPHIEITSFRNSKMDPKGGVYLGSCIEEDLSFRDFTVNAMAISALPIKGDEEIKIVDPTGGREDISTKTLRTPGNASDRFREDPLRILRVVRFASLLGFKIEDSTFETAHQMSSLLLDVSIERVRDEFFKIILSDNVRDGLEKLASLGFFKMFIPEIENCIGFEQNRFHKHDVFVHTLDVVELTDKDLLLRLAALFHDVGKPPSLTVDGDGERHFYLHEKIGADMLGEISERLRFSKQLSDGLKTLTYTHMRPLDAGAGGLRRIIRDTDPYYIEWRKLKYADTLAVLGEGNEIEKDFKNFDERIQDIISAEKDKPFRSLAVNGNDLINLGFKPGILFKEILSYLNEKVLDNPALNTKESLITLVQTKFTNKEDQTSQKQPS